MGSRLHYCNGYKHSSDFGVIDYSKNGGDINPECTPIDKEIDRMIAENKWTTQHLVVFLEGVVSDGLHRSIICPLVYEELFGSKICRHIWGYPWGKFVDCTQPIKIEAVVPFDGFCMEEDYYC